MNASLEHVNFTVPNSEASARLLCDLFDWKVRWSGPARNGGKTFHVGDDDRYIALYSPGSPEPAPSRRDGAMNHVGITVRDLDAMRARVVAAGIEPYGDDDYDPGRRFYFRDGDDVEFEVVSYA